MNTDRLLTEEEYQACWISKGRLKGFWSPDLVAEAQDAKTACKLVEDIEVVVLRELNHNLNNYPWWRSLKQELGFRIVGEAWVK